MTEWKAFGAMAIDFLGMPAEAMPLFGASDRKFRRRGEAIMAFVLESGNFGHNRQVVRSNRRMVGKIQSAWSKMWDFARHARVFPCDSVRFFFHFVRDGVGVAVGAVAG